jgi:hypothetical protein
VSDWEAETQVTLGLEGCSLPVGWEDGSVEPRMEAEEAGGCLPEDGDEEKEERQMEEYPEEETSEPETGE